MKVELFSPEQWSEVSASAHLIAFSEERDSSLDRISFALMAGDETTPYGFMTCLELNSESVYIQHGGATPASIGTTRSYHAFLAMLDWLNEDGVKQVTMLVKNTNKKMIKFAMTEFLITGTSNYKGEVYIEFFKTFKGV
jgi:hypothetical protein